MNSEYFFGNEFAIKFVTACNDYGFESVRESLYYSLVYDITDAIVIVNEDGGRTRYTCCGPDTSTTSLHALVKSADYLSRQQKLILMSGISGKINELYEFYEPIDEESIKLTSILFTNPRSQLVMSKAVGFRIFMHGQNFVVTPANLMHKMAESGLTSLGNLYIAEDTETFRYKGSIPSELVEYTHAPVYAEDGTPVMVIKPGVKIALATEDDYIQKYDWKPEFKG